MEATSFTLTNRLDQIEPVQNEILYILQARGVRLKQIDAILLAFGEWLENVIQHAYADELEHQIDVHLTVSDDEVRLRVSDDGRDFQLNDPAAPSPVPDGPNPKGQRDVNGRGLRLIRSLMDEVQHQRRDGKNHLVMVKQIIPFS